MRLPEKLQSEIDMEMGRINPQVIAKARNQLSESYRTGGLHKHMVSDADRLAYCAVRMPATYAAVCKVLGEIKARLPNVAIRSLLDLGSGPGTVLWAASEVFGPLDNATLFEGDSNLIKLGQKFSKGVKADWLHYDLSKELPELPERDLGVFSYSYGELPIEQRKSLLDKCWKAVKHALAIIEPGTPQGYKNMLEARDRLLASGGYMAAPCPHGKPCPMTGDDWCHFSVRLERSHYHQVIKEAYRGYEDEKFSYAIISKTPVPLPENRILRHPSVHSGHINLTLCSSNDKIVNTTISRRMGDLYKMAKDVEWGDPWPL